MRNVYTKVLAIAALAQSMLGRNHLPEPDIRVKNYDLKLPPLKITSRGKVKVARQRLKPATGPGSINIESEILAAIANGQHRKAMELRKAHQNFVNSKSGRQATDLNRRVDRKVRFLHETEANQ